MPSSPTITPRRPSHNSFPYTTPFRSTRREGSIINRKYNWSSAEVSRRSQAWCSCGRCGYGRRLPYPARPASTRRRGCGWRPGTRARSEEHTSELQSHVKLVCRLLLQSHLDDPAITPFPTRRPSDLRGEKGRSSTASITGRPRRLAAAHNPGAHAADVDMGAGCLTRHGLPVREEGDAVGGQVLAQDRKSVV